MNIKFYLFVQKGCRPCSYVEHQLKSVEGWEDFVVIVDARKPSSKSLVMKYEVIGTPTLVAEKPDGSTMKISKPTEMNKTFWKELFDKMSSL
jgi:thioredoxin-related protein